MCISSLYPAPIRIISVKMPILIVIYRSVRLQSHENVEGMLFIYDPIFRVELEKCGGLKWLQLYGV